MSLYPLQLTTITLPKVWGQEIWHITQMNDRLSVVTNGYLEGNDISDLIEVYMGELVGEHVYERYGNYFPLLFKVISTFDDLSIQVHPDDEFAWQMHQLPGKSELWYVLNANPDTTLISGFCCDTSADKLRAALTDDSLTDCLNIVPVKRGDVVALPAGRVHALRRNIIVAEIQQNSDLTYRLYDYNRPGLDGKPRELHVENALQVLDYQQLPDPLTHYEPVLNGAVNLVSTDHFVTNLLTFDSPIGRDYAPLDSFVVYMCVEGSADVSSEGVTVTLKEGDTVLIPASLDDVLLSPHTSAKILETYVPD